MSALLTSRESAKSEFTVGHHARRRAGTNVPEGGSDRYLKICNKSKAPAIILYAVETAANNATRTRDCLHPLSELLYAETERALERRTQIPRNGLFM